MRLIVLIIMFWVSSIQAHHPAPPPEPELEYTVNGYASLLAYKTTRNNLIPYREHSNGDQNSMNGKYLIEGGFLFSVSYQNFYIKHMITNDKLIDYGFLDFNFIGSNGIRAGRVNRLSGFFGGFGPHSDYMNFLPQGDSPLRFADTFFRFDGIQIYSSVPYKKAQINLSLTYGEPYVGDSIGAFDPTLFAILNKKDFELKSERLSWFYHFDINSSTWQVFFDYLDGTIAIEGIADIPGPNNTLQHVPVGIPNYPVRIIKLGIGYSFTVSELLFTFYEQTGYLPKNRPFTLAGRDLGHRFTSLGGSVMFRYNYNFDTLLYTGYSFYKLDRGSKFLNSLGKNAPEHIDYQHNFFMGITKNISPSIHIVGELQYNIGTATLSATYQDPLESEKCWAVPSVSINYVF